MLSPFYEVEMQLYDKYPPTDPANDSALYIFTPFNDLVKDRPPHYIMYQTEQTGSSWLTPGEKKWANRRGNDTLTDFAEAFRVPSLSPPAPHALCQTCSMPSVTYRSMLHY